MPDTFGLLQLPVPVPADPRAEAVGDPLLDLVAAFVKAVLNADVGAAWASVYPATPLPVAFTETHDPNEGAFTTKRTPCLYVYRADEPPPRAIRTTQDWDVVRTAITLLLVPPPPTQDKQKIRTNLRNAIDKSIRAAVRQGRHPAWVVAGDTLYNATDYGSTFVTRANLQSWYFTLGGFKRVPITVETDDGDKTTTFFGLLGNVLVDELLVRGAARYAALANVQGTVSLGKNADGLNALPILSYQFQPTILSVTPAAGSSAGGAPITIKGRQFYRLTASGQNTTAPALLGCVDATVATSEGVALLNVTFVDEGTFTATMPARPLGAGIVGLVMTMPNGSTATLANAFTYA
jgi:hypothetical protein